MQDANESTKKQALFLIIRQNLIEQTNTIQKSGHYFSIEIIDFLFEFLLSKDTHALTMIPNHRLFQTIRHSPAFQLQQFCELSSRLRYLAAVEGENNQHKAKALLENNRELAPRLLSSQGLMNDAAGRRFKQPLSAFAYLYWVGNTPFRTMLEDFLDDAAIQQLYMQCKDINDDGLEISLNGETITHSHFFDMQPLIKAAFDYQEAAKPLISKKNWREKTWEPVQLLWLKYGEELGKLPIWIAQEFCSKQSFCPSPSFEELEVEQTIMFENLTTGQRESWFANGKPNSALGDKIAIQKVDGERAWGLALRPTDALQRGLSDLGALVRMHRVRFLRHPKQALQKLEAAALAESSFVCKT